MKSSLQRKIQRLKNPHYAAFYNWRQKHFYTNMIFSLTFFSSFILAVLLVKEAPSTLLDELLHTKWHYPLYYLSVWELLAYKGMSHLRENSLKNTILSYYNNL